ncbi:MAG: glutamate racemase [Parcubacteria bacterium C7867-006]|nr:MAG: glutamate racemase [Parcubacteria bacterium C7867-006]
MKFKSIGVFDSGFGGLDILKGIVKKLPEYNYIYLGDTARAPYGNRSQEKIFEFSKQAVDFLFAEGCELVIFACNTASSDALRRIQQEYLPKKYPNKRVLGVLIPAVEESVTKTKNSKVGVVATVATVKSEAFIDEFKKVNPKVKVFQKACPLLVPIVESGEIKNPATDIIIKNYLKPLIDKKIDTLVLGCTHYGLLENKIKKAVGPSVSIVSEARVVPDKLSQYLKRHSEIERKLGKNKKIRFCSTDITDSFQKLGSLFFGKNIKTEQVSL